jgi:hypothetical protein
MKTAFFTRKLATGTLISAPAVYTGTDKQTYIVLKVGSLTALGPLPNILLQSVTSSKICTGRAVDVTCCAVSTTTHNSCDSVGV